LPKSIPLNLDRRQRAIGERQLHQLGLMAGEVRDASRAVERGRVVAHHHVGGALDSAVLDPAQALLRRLDLLLADLHLDDLALELEPRAVGGEVDPTVGIGDEELRELRRQLEGLVLRGLLVLSDLDELDVGLGHASTSPTMTTPSRGRTRRSRQSGT
jgi:hypothetical protein